MTGGWTRDTAIAPTDPLTYGGAAMLLLLVALMAALIPARAAARVDPLFYWEHRQFRPFPQMSLVLRTVGNPADVVPAVRTTLRELDPNLPLYNVRSMDDLFAQVIARPRFTTVSLTLFAVLALIVAAIGTYAVIAYATEQRAREIGIRIALGADRAAVLRMILGQGLVLIGISLLLGTLGAPVRHVVTVRCGFQVCVSSRT